MQKISCPRELASVMFTGKPIYQPGILVLFPQMMHSHPFTISFCLYPRKAAWIRNSQKLPGSAKKPPEELFLQLQAVLGALQLGLLLAQSGFSLSCSSWGSRLESNPSSRAVREGAGAQTLSSEILCVSWRWGRKWLSSINSSLMEIRMRTAVYSLFPAVKKCSPGQSWWC